MDCLLTIVYLLYGNLVSEFLRVWHLSLSCWKERLSSVGIFDPNLLLGIAWIVTKPLANWAAKGSTGREMSQSIWGGVKRRSQKSDVLDKETG